MFIFDRVFDAFSLFLSSVALLANSFSRFAKRFRDATRESSSSSNGGFVVGISGSSQAAARESSVEAICPDGPLPVEQRLIQAVSPLKPLIPLDVGLVSEPDNSHQHLLQNQHFVAVNASLASVNSELFDYAIILLSLLYVFCCCDVHVRFNHKYRCLL